MATQIQAECLKEFEESMQATEKLQVIYDLIVQNQLNEYHTLIQIEKDELKLLKEDIDFVTSLQTMGKITNMKSLYEQKQQQQQNIQSAGTEQKQQQQPPKKQLGALRKLGHESNLNWWKTFKERCSERCEPIVQCIVGDRDAFEEFMTSIANKNGVEYSVDTFRGFIEEKYAEKMDELFQHDIYAIPCTDCEGPGRYKASFFKIHGDNIHITNIKNHYEHKSVGHPPVVQYMELQDVSNQETPPLQNCQVAWSHKNFNNDVLLRVQDKKHPTNIRYTYDPSNANDPQNVHRKRAREKSFVAGKMKQNNEKYKKKRGKKYKTVPFDLKPASPHILSILQKTVKAKKKKDKTKNKKEKNKNKKEKRKKKNKKTIKQTPKKSRKRQREDVLSTGESESDYSPSSNSNKRKRRKISSRQTRSMTKKANAITGSDNDDMDKDDSDNDESEKESESESQSQSESESDCQHKHKKSEKVLKKMDIIGEGCHAPLCSGRCDKRLNKGQYFYLCSKCKGKYLCNKCYQKR